MHSSLAHPRDQIADTMARIYRYGMTTTSDGYDVDDRLRTDQMDVTGDGGRPEEVAATIVFLISPVKRTLVTVWTRKLCDRLHRS